MDFEVRPLGLQPFLEPAQHRRRVARRGGHQVMGFAKARCDAVVHHHAVLAQHQAIAGAADGELAPGVGVDPVEKFGAVTALDVDLAQG